MKRLCIVLAAGSLLACEQAGAQIIDISWFSIDGGVETCAAGGFSLTGTVGQPDAGTLTGLGYEIEGGFWSAPTASAACYANCDGSTIAPILNINDFNCFLNKFASSDPYANCDASTSQPILNINDFQCFVNRFAVGCTGI